MCGSLVMNESYQRDLYIHKRDLHTYKGQIRCVFVLCKVSCVCHKPCLCVCRSLLCVCWSLWLCGVCQVRVCVGLLHVCWCLLRFGQVLLRVLFFVCSLLCVCRFLVYVCGCGLCVSRSLLCIYRSLLRRQSSIFSMRDTSLLHRSPQAES